MSCPGTRLPTQAGRCSACDRFAPIGTAEGALMPEHTRARLTVDAVLDAEHRLSGDAARMMETLTKERRT